MYSKELEELIENVLEDGVITEQERAVLCKRAQACGEDPDEVLVVVEGRLAKAKKAAKPSNEKRGNVVHCPACGAIVGAGAIKCKECGYVFTNVKANSSAERFAKEFAALIDKYKDASLKGRIQRDREIKQFIKNFPIPTSKEDMLEFIVSLDARRREAPDYTGHMDNILGANSDYREAYNTKYKECATKAKVLFADDAQIKALLSQTKRSSFSAISKKIAIVIICIVVYGALGYYWYTEYKKDSNTDPEKVELIDRQYDDICEKVDALPTPTKSNYDDCAMAIKRIDWKKISDGGRDGRATESYEDDVKSKAFGKVNSYIEMLHTIHSKYIDSKGRPTNENYSNGVENIEDTKYIELIKFNENSDE